MIDVSSLSIAIGKFELRDVSFNVPEGAYGMLMGQTGSGKTTLIEALIGLKKTRAHSRIVIAGRDVTRLPPAERNIGYVPQDGALFSTMTVRGHLAFALDVRRAPAAYIEQRVAELANQLRIEHLLERMPEGLSGGERQRVVLGRALSFHPRVLLLDEPLSALDEDTRNGMYEVLRQVRKSTGVTVLHVTHSFAEAEALADCRYVLKDGKIELQ